MNNTHTYVTEMVELGFSYGETMIFSHVNASIQKGKKIALWGPSGSGKSTLLHLVGLLDKPTSGVVYMNHNTKWTDTRMLTENEKTQLRRMQLGFVHQFHHLLPEFTALENVIMPQIIAGKDKKTAHEKAAYLLSTVGLHDRMTHRPSQLSGGQQQRVAIARALANDPALIVADEPTGNVDAHAAQTIMDLFHTLCSEGVALLMATHNRDLLHNFDTVWSLDNRTLSESDAHLWT